MLMTGGSLLASAWQATAALLLLCHRPWALLLTCNARFPLFLLLHIALAAVEELAAEGRPACVCQGSVPFWPSVLSQLTGYSESGSPPFASAIAHAGRLCSKLYTSVDSSMAPNLPPAPGGPGLGEL